MGPSNHRAVSLEVLESRRLLSAARYAGFDFFTDGGVGSELVQVGKTGFFFGGTGNDSVSLYNTDGTVAGTSIVRSGFKLFAGIPMASLGNQLIFIASTSTSNPQVWRSDGTTAGTFPITSFPTSAAFYEASLISVAGQVFFLADDSVHGQELWATDGTAIGTHMVKEITPGSAGTSIFGLVPVGNRLMFRADDGIHGSELWNSDGTDAGTQLAIDLNPGAASSDINLEIGLGNRLIFSLNTPATGTELWSFDGVSASLLKDIRPGSGSSTPMDLTVFGNEVIFNANDGITGTELWRTDGTPSGTTQACDFTPGSGSTFFNSLNAIGNRLFAVIAHGLFLWNTGTQTFDPVTGLKAGQPATDAGAPTAIGSQVAFVGSGVNNGPEIWFSDGTSAGTHQIADIAPGNVGSKPQNLSSLGSRVFFFADDIVHGSQPWITDGTAAGTYMLTNVKPATRQFPVERVWSVGDTLYAYSTKASSVPVMVATDGTANGGRIISGYVSPDFFLPTADGRVFFGGTIGVWITAGTAQSTQYLSDAYVNRYLGPTSDAAVVGNTLFFATHDLNGSSLWRSDGTVAGTVKVKQFNFSAVPISHLASVGSRLFFLGYDPVTGIEPYVSDGTSAGTVLLKDVRPGSLSSPLLDSYGRMISFAMGNAYYFVADDGVNHHGLWRTDGTQTGTTFLKELAPGSTLPANAYSPTLIAGNIAYFVFQTANGFTLYTTDGTPTGTQSISTFPARLSGTALLGDGLIFSYYDPGEVFSLYRLDLTTKAITTIATFDAGIGVTNSPLNPSIASFVPLQGKVYFAVTTKTTGRDLWETDGLTARLVQDVPAPSGYPDLGPDYYSTFNGAVWYVQPSGVWATPSVTATSVSGLAFNDVNRNGNQDAGETGLAGRTVFIDLDRGGTFDAGEPSSLTLADGSFSIAGLYPGDYLVRQVLTANWTQTQPSTGGLNVSLNGSPVTGLKFGSLLTNSPFSGTPISISSTAATILQVENFDNGGEGIAFHDNDIANIGGNSFRSTPVDLGSTADGGSGGVIVNFTKPGEWLKYSVNVAQAGKYNIGLRVACLKTGGTVHLEIDGTKVGSSITVSDTGSWTTWKTITINNVTLPAGNHILKLAFDTAGSLGYVGDFNYLSFTPVVQPPPPPPPPGYTGKPFKGTTVSIGSTSSTIEFENFDDGGEGVAYHDVESTNLPKTTYRTSGVDIEAISDGAAGYGVGFVKAGEWLKYTINVLADGTYDLDVRLASLTGGGAYHFELDGVRLTSNATVPKSGAWTTYTTQRVGTVSMKAGLHVLRVVFDSNGSTGYVANFNWLKFTRR